MFNVMWKLKVKYLQKKMAFYVLVGNVEKANECYAEVVKMLAAYIDVYLTPAFKQEGS